jgi:hypothetical protein
MLATKAFGREIRGGIGFFWFSPIIYIDTSDMWLAPRSQRIIVSIAGPYAELAFGSLAALVAAFGSGGVRTGAEEVAFFGVLLKFCPLLELDGYYTLTHLLDRPNLRRHSLAYLVDGLPGVIRRRESLRGHGVEVAYAFASLVFVGLITAATIVLYRGTLQAAVERLVPSGVATLIGSCSPQGSSCSRAPPWSETCSRQDVDVLHNASAILQPHRLSSISITSSASHVASCRRWRRQISAARSTSDHVSTSSSSRAAPHRSFGLVLSATLCFNGERSTRRAVRKGTLEDTPRCGTRSAPGDLTERGRG